MYSGGSNTQDEMKKKAYVKILEQPASKALRFRYECEGRSAGSIPGVNSTPESKTFPSIQIVGYKGRAVVVVSCVTKDQPYRPHPHNLVGKEGCKKGVCTVEITSESMAVTFSNLGIQCVKKKDIDEALKVREEIRVDPYRTGFSHRSQPTSIDLNAVRLCFQVFLEGAEQGKFTYQLKPVVSDPIFDKKAMSDLVICKLSECSATVAGGKEIILLCEKVAKEDIQVRFYEEQNGLSVWEGFGDFQPTHVHKQVAISFRAPRYHSIEVNNPVKVNIQLRRPSDGATSESLPFEFVPIDSERRRKMPKPLLAQFQERDKSRAYAQGEQKPFLHVKREPMDTLTSPGHMFVGNTSPIYGLTTSPSPQPAAPKMTQTPSPSPHSMGRTPSPMDYRFPSSQFPSNMYDTFGGVRLPEGINVSLVPGIPVASIMPTGGGIVNKLGHENNSLGGSRQQFGIAPHSAAAGMNLHPSLGHGDPSRIVGSGLPSPGTAHSPASTNPSPGPGLAACAGTSVPPLPNNRVNISSLQGISNVTPVPGLEEGNILDLDRHQYSLTPLNSGDLYDLNLSENLSNYLSLSENQQSSQTHQQQQLQITHQLQQHHMQQQQQHLQQQQHQLQQQLQQQLEQQQQQQQQHLKQDHESQENMTDSFTRLTTEICNLNEMFKGGGN